MNNEIIWFVFHLVAHYYELHGGSDYTWQTALEIAARDLNVVIMRHNVSCYERSQGELGWHNTSDYTDNQCVFKLLLENDRPYKQIDINRFK